MGSDWIKTITSLKKVKPEKKKDIKVSSNFKKATSSKWKRRSQKESTCSFCGSTREHHGVTCSLSEDIAAIRIQTALRAFLARRRLRSLKGIARLQILTQGSSVTKQASTTLNYLHSWGRIQTQIMARRQSMVREGWTRQKKLENQLKLEAKLHDLEVEWCSGSETMEETVAKIHQREEAAVKRERAMAYAFSHQWRASSHNQGPSISEIGRASWGWSWMECWIAARPWESRVSVQLPSPKKCPTKQSTKVGKKLKPVPTKIGVSVKPVLLNGKVTTTTRRLSNQAAGKPAASEAKSKVTEANTAKKEQLAS